MSNSELFHGFVDQPNLASALGQVFAEKPDLIGPDDDDLMDLYMAVEVPVEPWGYKEKITRFDLQEAVNGEEEFARAWADENQQNVLLFKDQRDMYNDSYT